MFKKLVADRFLKALENIEYGHLDIIIPEGKLYEFVGKKSGVYAQFTIHDWKVITNLATKGDIGFAEDYRDGLWETDNLTNLLLIALENAEALNPYIYGGIFSRALEYISYIFDKNTLKGSKRNIHAHYDLGNTFYKLWLDPSMTYSSAIFNSDNDSLEQAQYNKYQRIIDRLGNSGSLLEVGCGWGGFAERALHKGDFDIKGITLSKEQHEYANQRLENNAQISIEDYRHQQGKYDFLVSIEMFEAVGEHFWSTYFDKIKSLMKQSGKAMIQTITIDDKLFETYRRGGDMIRTYIFPGGMLPSPMRFSQEAEKAGLKITDSFGFGLDYAKTLEEWLVAFEEKKEQIKLLGFDEAFIRMWRFYLASCIASFKSNRTNVIQVELQHA